MRVLGYKEIKKSLKDVADEIDKELEEHVDE